MKSNIFMVSCHAQNITQTRTAVKATSGRHQRYVAGGVRPGPSLSAPGRAGAFGVFGRLVLLEREAPDLAGGWGWGAKGRRPQARSSRLTLSQTSKCARGSCNYH
jgi:hypothetical protein